MNSKKKSTEQIKENEFKDKPKTNHTESELEFESILYLNQTNEIKNFSVCVF